MTQKRLLWRFILLFRGISITSFSRKRIGGFLPYKLTQIRGYAVDQYQVIDSLINCV